MEFLDLIDQPSDGQVAIMNVDEATRVLCYTDTDFRVREWVLHNRQWQGGHAHNTIVYADQQTPLAMISIDLGNNVSFTRFFYV
jgi:hypothetical protein